MADLGLWLILAGSLPTLALLARVVLLRYWVSYFGRRAVATVLASQRVATLPHLMTEVALELTPHGEPGYVRIRARMRWNEHTIAPEQLVAGARLAVRYRPARQTVVMPDARSR